MFWQLLLGPVIGGQAQRIAPLSAEAWKALFDERTGRTWPSARLSARTRFTKEYVLKQFWESFVDDKFDLDNAIQTKAEFSCATAVMDKIEGWEEEKLGWVQICGKHVDLHKGCDLQRPK